MKFNEAVEQILNEGPRQDKLKAVIKTVNKKLKSHKDIKGIKIKSGKFNYDDMPEDDLFDKINNGIEKILKFVKGMGDIGLSNYSNDVILKIEGFNTWQKVNISAWEYRDKIALEGGVDGNIQASVDDMDKFVNDVVLEATELSEMERDK